MKKHLSTGGAIAASLVGITLVLLLSGAAVVATAVVPDAGLTPDSGETASLPPVVPDTRAAVSPVAFGAAQDGYPALCVDEDGNPIAHWYFEEGTRDNLWYNVYG